MSRLNDSALPQKIIDYLKTENRPFSANDIFSNLSIDGGKTAMTRALLQLVSDDKVKEKTYGKQKVYYINQNVFNDLETDCLQSMDAKISELSNTLNSLQKQIKMSEAVLEDLTKSLPTEKVEAELIAVKTEISVLKDKLQSLESKAVSIDPKEKKNLCEKKEMCLKVYKRRKRLANNVIDAILEGYPKSKKQLLEELGVEENDKKL